MSSDTVAVTAEFGIGAPATAVLLELLGATGVRRFVNIGTAKSLVRLFEAGRSVLSP